MATSASDIGHLPLVCISLAPIAACPNLDRSRCERHQWLWAGLCARGELLCWDGNHLSRCGRDIQSSKVHPPCLPPYLTHLFLTNHVQGVNTVVYRILFVYMGLIFFQGLICPSNSPALLNADSKAASSPFTIGFVAAGWKSAGQFVNTLTIIAFISAGNGCIYVQSRALYSLALSGRAPKIFAITSKKGVPYVSILTSCCWGFLALMNMKIGAGQVFVYMTSVGGTAAYIAWSGIVFTHLRVRAGLEKQGIHPLTFPFKVFGTIWIYRFNLFLNIFILLIQGFVAFEKPFNWRNFIASYITIPSSIVLYIGYKLYHKTRFVRLSEMDFSDRLVKIEEDEEEKRPGLIVRALGRFRD